MTAPTGSQRADLRAWVRTTYWRQGKPTVDARIADVLPDRLLESAANDAGANALVAAGRLEPIERPGRVEQRHAAGHDAFLHRRLGGAQGVLGDRGTASERVAEEAVAAVLAPRASGGALDVHLADQLLVPLAPAPGASRFAAEGPSRHPETNARVIERFGLARTVVAKGPREAALVTVRPEAP